MLRADLWPAEAVLPDGRLLQGVRVQVTRNDMVVVWQDVTGVAKAILAEPVAGHEYLPPLGAALAELRLTSTLASGGTVHAHQTAGSGCGCGGSPLRDLGEADAVAVERVVAGQAVS